MQTKTLHTQITVPAEGITAALFNQSFDDLYVLKLAQQLAIELIKSKLVETKIDNVLANGPTIEDPFNIYAEYAVIHAKLEVVVP